MNSYETQGNLTFSPDESLQVEAGDTLHVYLSGISHLVSADGGEYEYFPSKYTIGLQHAGGEMWSENGHMVAEAISQYSELTEIPVEIHYLEEYTGSSDVLQKLYDEGKPMPDLLVATKSNQYDYIRLARQGLLLDFSSYMEKDESLNEEVYYSKILQGGKIEEGSYILPILFNMNGLITSAGYLKEIGVEMPSENSSFEDILYLLEKSCKAMESFDYREAIFEESGMRAGGYIPSILLSAAYPRYYEEKIGVGKEALTDIFSLMKAYNRQEFMNIPGWENNEYLLNVNDNVKSMDIYFQREEAIENIGIFLTGGRCGGTNYFSSLLTDAAYFHAEYGDNLVVGGIPTMEGPDTYSANITLMAMGFSETKYPEIVYNLSRYLMDYEYSMAYGFSVNKEITEKQLEDIQSTYMTIYDDSLWGSFRLGLMTEDQIKSRVTNMEPLDKETVQIIRHMLEHIAGAGLPNGLVENIMINSMLNMVGDDRMIPEEAANWIIEKQEEHQALLGTLEPFYDEVYEQTIKLGGLP